VSKVIENFGKISEISTSNIHTFNKIFLTFDIDWACDEILSDAISLVEEANLPATWFVTNETPLLSRLRGNPNFELGVHPNFNYLLDGNSKNGHNAEEVLDRLLDLVPEAKSIRSHSLLQSERLIDLFAAKGLSHVSNFFIPASGLVVSPWKLWNGITAIPHCWQDNVSCLLNKTIQPPPATASGTRVFDFHPIHIFLNTDCMGRYESTRNIHRNPEELMKRRYKGKGARSYLKSLLESNECV